MLYPQINKHRSVLDLSGLWKFRPDPDDVGEQERWFDRLKTDVDIAVPGSWNEQLEELGLLHYCGSAWYETSLEIPLEFSGRRIWLRIGSADYSSRVWINGILVGENGFGFLPFEFDISPQASPGETVRITIRVDNRLSDESIPQGVLAEYYAIENRLREETNPPARFDFSPFGGIHRPVKLCTTADSHIRDLKVDTSIAAGQRGVIDLEVTTEHAEGFRAVCTLFADGPVSVAAASAEIKGAVTSFSFDIPHCSYWSPDSPFLHRLAVEIWRDAATVDSYTLNVGVREVRIEGTTLLLNEGPVYLKGFGKHEDFAVLGKGLSLPVVVKDFQLMKWINANSLRTSHYPYAEEVMEMADRHGILVIDEVPANSLDMRHVKSRTLDNHKAFFKRLHDRDHNHPSVIMWALGNEPNLVGEESYYDGSGRKYWKEVFAYARSLDATRPMMVPNCLRAGVNDPVFEFSDVVAINRYYGWYEYPGRLDHAMTILNEEMEWLYAKFKKPMMMTEFGADTISGYHSTSDQLFTEEYQGNLIARYIALLRTKSFVIGEHVWNFADFRTPQHFRRVVLNRKGVFTREREPKNAAFRLKTLWSERILRKG